VKGLRVSKALRVENVSLIWSAQQGREVRMSTGHSKRFIRQWFSFLGHRRELEKPFGAMFRRETV
jgi:hypothetical protein